MKEKKSMKSNILISDYVSTDAKQLTQIFYNTIHKINCADYSQAQVNAWAPRSCLETSGWKDKWETTPPIVARINYTITGFAELEKQGHIDCFYVHHKFQRQGVGSALMCAIIKKAKNLKLQRIFAESSITAKPFFESHGFSIIKPQTVIIRGMIFKNFIVEKKITDCGKI